MPLFKLKDFDPDYRDRFDGTDVKDLDLYTQGGEKIGSVDDVMVDQDGRFRYLVINTGAWIFGKKVLLPIGLAKINYTNRRVTVDGLNKKQVENLPDVGTLEKIEYEHEEQVRNIYRPMATSTANTASMAGVGYDRDTYSYDYEPGLYQMSDRDHQNFKLFEERLIANKRRVKTGEVAIGKHVETENARVSVPLDKERVVVERTAPTTTTGAPGSDAFREGEVARVEVYEETPDIHKEAFVREEVKVKKVVEHETAQAADKIRRETLDVDTDGNPIIRDRT